jgi:hypothetical protein
MKLSATKEVLTVGTRVYFAGKRGTIIGYYVDYPVMLYDEPSKGWNPGGGLARAFPQYDPARLSTLSEPSLELVEVITDQAADYFKLAQSAFQVGDRVRQKQRVVTYLPADAIGTVVDVDTSETDYLVDWAGFGSSWFNKLWLVRDEGAELESYFKLAQPTEGLDLNFEEIPVARVRVGDYIDHAGRESQVMAKQFVPKSDENDPGYKLTLRYADDTEEESWHFADWTVYKLRNVPERIKPSQERYFKQSSSSKKWYHGTNSHALPDILKYGLVYGPANSAVSLTSSYDFAAFFADMSHTEREFYSQLTANDVPRVPIILELELDQDQLSYYRHFHSPWGEVDEHLWTPARPIPPARITHVHRFSPDQKGWLRSEAKEYRNAEPATYDRITGRLIQPVQEPRGPLAFFTKRVYGDYVEANEYLASVFGQSYQKDAVVYEVPGVQTRAKQGYVVLDAELRPEEKAYELVRVYPSLHYQSDTSILEQFQKPVDRLAFMSKYAQTNQAKFKPGDRVRSSVEAESYFHTAQVPVNRFKLGERVQTKNSPTMPDGTVGTIIDTSPIPASCNYCVQFDEYIKGPFSIWINEAWLAPLPENERYFLQGSVSKQSTKFDRSQVKVGDQVKYKRKQWMTVQNVRTADNGVIWYQVPTGFKDRPWMEVPSDLFTDWEKGDPNSLEKPLTQEAYFKVSAFLKLAADELPIGTRVRAANGELRIIDSYRLELAPDGYGYWVRWGANERGLINEKNFTVEPPDPAETYFKQSAYKPVAIGSRVRAGAGSKFVGKVISKPVDAGDGNVGYWIEWQDGTTQIVHRSQFIVEAVPAESSSDEYFRYGSVSKQAIDHELPQGTRVRIIADDLLYDEGLKSMLGNEGEIQNWYSEAEAYKILFDDGTIAYIFPEDFEVISTEPVDEYFKQSVRLGKCYECDGIGNNTCVQCSKAFCVKHGDGIRCDNCIDEILHEGAHTFECSNCGGRTYAVTDTGSVVSWCKNCKASMKHYRITTERERETYFKLANGLKVGDPVYSIQERFGNKLYGTIAEIRDNDVWIKWNEGGEDLFDADQVNVDFFPSDLVGWPQVVHVGTLKGKKTSYVDLELYLGDDGKYHSRLKSGSNVRDITESPVDPTEVQSVDDLITMARHEWEATPYWQEGFVWATETEYFKLGAWSARDFTPIDARNVQVGHVLACDPNDPNTKLGTVQGISWFQDLLDVRVLDTEGVTETLTFKHDDIVWLYTPKNEADGYFKLANKTLWTCTATNPMLGGRTKEIVYRIVDDPDFYLVYVNTTLIRNYYKRDSDLRNVADNVRYIATENNPRAVSITEQWLTDEVPEGYFKLAQPGESKREYLYEDPNLHFEKSQQTYWRDIDVGWGIGASVHRDYGWIPNFVVTEIEREGPIVRWRGRAYTDPTVKGSWVENVDDWSWASRPKRREQDQYFKLSQARPIDLKKIPASELKVGDKIWYPQSSDTVRSIEPCENYPDKLWLTVDRGSVGVPVSYTIEQDRRIEVEVYASERYFKLASDWRGGDRVVFKDYPTWGPGTIISTSHNDYPFTIVVLCDDGDRVSATPEQIERVEEQTDYFKLASVHNVPTSQLRVGDRILFVSAPEHIVVDLKKVSPHHYDVTLENVETGDRATERRHAGWPYRIAVSEEDLYFKQSMPLHQSDFEEVEVDRLEVGDVVILEPYLDPEPYTVIWCSSINRGSMSATELEQYLPDFDTWAKLDIDWYTFRGRFRSLRNRSTDEEEWLIPSQADRNEKYGDASNFPMPTVLRYNHAKATGETYFKLAQPAYPTEGGVDIQVKDLRVGDTVKLIGSSRAKVLSIKPTNDEFGRLEVTVRDTENLLGDTIVECRPDEWVVIEPRATSESDSYFKLGSDRVLAKDLKPGMKIRIMSPRMEWVEGEVREVIQGIDPRICSIVYAYDWEGRPGRKRISRKDYFPDTDVTDLVVPEADEYFKLATEDEVTVERIERTNPFKVGDRVTVNWAPGVSGDNFPKTGTVATGDNWRVVVRCDEPFEEPVCSWSIITSWLKAGDLELGQPDQPLSLTQDDEPYCVVATLEPGQVERIEQDAYFLQS